MGALAGQREEAPVVELFIRRAASLKGTKVIVANPRRIHLTGYGGPWLACRPGTEVALLNGQAHVILARGLHKEGRNVAELNKWVKDYPPDKVEEITAVSAETLREAMTQNPYLRVFIANGYYDLATPYFATHYTFNHLGLDQSLRENVSMSHYEAGHMMYVHQPSLAKLKQDLADFIQLALPQ